MTHEQWAEAFAALRVRHSANDIANALGVNRATLYRWKHSAAKLPGDIDDRVAIAEERLRYIDGITAIVNTLPKSELREMLRSLVHNHS